jgi:hypothetical protein
MAAVLHQLTYRSVVLRHLLSGTRNNNYVFILESVRHLPCLTKCTKTAVREQQQWKCRLNSICNISPSVNTTVAVFFGPFALSSWNYNKRMHMFTFYWNAQTWIHIIIFSCNDQCEYVGFNLKRVKLTNSKINHNIIHPPTSWIRILYCPECLTLLILGNFCDVGTLY